MGINQCINCLIKTANAPVVLHRVWIKTANAPVVLHRVWIKTANAPVVLHRVWIKIDNAQVVLHRVWIKTENAQVVLHRVWKSTSCISCKIVYQNSSPFYKLLENLNLVKWFCKCCLIRLSKIVRHFVCV